MNLYNMYILPIQIYMHKLQLQKKQKTKSGCKRDSMERPLVNIYIYIYIYTFWNFDNKFLVGVGFKFLKLRCMLHVLLKHLLDNYKILKVDHVTCPPFH